MVCPGGGGLGPIVANPDGSIPAMGLSFRCFGCTQPKPGPKDPRNRHPSGQDLRSDPQKQSPNLRFRKSDCRLMAADHRLSILLVLDHYP